MNRKLKIMMKKLKIKNNKFKIMSNKYKIMNNFKINKIQTNYKILILTMIMMIV